MNYLELPVYKNHEKILSALKDNQAVVVESPTGSGKTTQLPVILYEAGYSHRGIIGVTQPRRIAAVSVSEFIARQTETPPGGLIGYKMRFEDRTSPQTKIKRLTDGMLLQEMKLDPWLSKYSVLVVDEAHERSLNIDFSLGLLKRVLESRREFKVIISSATINAEVFCEYFGGCPVVKIDAQRFPVTLIYDPPAVHQRASMRDVFIHGAKTHDARTHEKWHKHRHKETHHAGDGSDTTRADGSDNGGATAAEALLEKIEKIVTRFITEKRKGDILVFLSGEKAIKDCVTRLSLSRIGGKLHLLPLYGRLGKEEQERVFETAPRGRTKVVLSTNIAETSVTIEGITAVIDSGLSKLNWYNPNTFTSSLVEAPISKASADQRKGRAGRTCEGSCYRLYERNDFEGRPQFTTEEIFRTDLSEVILRMSDLGITDFEGFDFISTPGIEGLEAGIETLNLLHALESDRSLSNIGKMMTEFPLAPRQSRIIVEAILRYPDVLRETLIAAAFLSTQSPYLLPPGEETEARKAHGRFRDQHGDFVSYLKIFKAYCESLNKAKFCDKNYLDEKAMAEIVNVVAQLEEIIANLKIPVLEGGDVNDYLCCIATGMIQFVCVRKGAAKGSGGKGGGRNVTYRSLTADQITIHPGSVMFRTDPMYIVAGEIVRTSRMYAMSVSPLSMEIIERLGIEIKEERKEKKEKRKTREESHAEAQRHRGEEKRKGKRGKGKKPKKKNWENEQ
jgi:HrpA-like RNA helicase